MPASFRYSCAEGRRRSASTTSTGLPLWASVTARLSVVIDLPSYPEADVTASTRQSALDLE